MNIPGNEKMVKVRKANRVLTIQKDEAENYLKMGYAVYSLTGEKIAEPDTYRSRLEEAQREIARLTAELEAAQRENARLSRQLKASGK